MPVDRYLNFFSWDEAKHPHRRPLPEIVSIIQAVRASLVSKRVVVDSCVWFH